MVRFASASIPYFAVKTEDDEGYTLMRRESKRLEVDPVEGDTGDVYALFNKITGLELEYHDPKHDEWVMEWDSESVDNKDKLPDAVKITIKFVDTLKREITLTQIALIPMTTPLAF